MRGGRLGSEFADRWPRGCGAAAPGGSACGAWRPGGSAALTVGVAVGVLTSATVTVAWAVAVGVWCAGARGVAVASAVRATGCSAALGANSRANGPAHTAATARLAQLTASLVVRPVATTVPALAAPPAIAASCPVRRAASPPRPSSAPRRAAARSSSADRGQAELEHATHPQRERAAVQAVVEVDFDAGDVVAVERAGRFAVEQVADRCARGPGLRVRQGGKPPLAGAREPPLVLRAGDPELRGHLVRCVLLEVAQPQHLGVLCAQPRQRAFNDLALARAQVGVAEGLLGFSGRVRELCRGVQGDDGARSTRRVAAVAAAQLVDRVAAQRASQVRAPGAPAGRQARIGGELGKRVGDEVLGVLDGQGTRELAGQPGHERVALVGEPFQRRARCEPGHLEV